MAQLIGEKLPNTGGFLNFGSGSKGSCCRHRVSQPVQLLLCVAGSMTQSHCWDTKQKRSPKYFSGNGFNFQIKPLSNYTAGWIKGYQGNRRILSKSQFSKWKETIFKNCFGKTGLSSSFQVGKTASSITPLWHRSFSYNIHALDLGSTWHKIDTDTHMESWVSDWENKASRSWPFAPWAGKGSREAGRKPSGPGEKHTWSLFSPLQKEPLSHSKWGLVSWLSCHIFNGTGMHLSWTQYLATNFAIFSPSSSEDTREYWSSHLIKR